MWIAIGGIVGGLAIVVVLVFLGVSAWRDAHWLRGPCGKCGASVRACDGATPYTCHDCGHTGVIAP